MRLHILLERAASTLALNRLIQRDQESLERQTHRTLTAALMGDSLPSAEIPLRARALGVPLEGRRLLGAVVRPRQRPPAGVGALEAQARLRDLTEGVAPGCVMRI